MLTKASCARDYFNPWGSSAAKLYILELAMQACAVRKGVVDSRPLCITIDTVFDCTRKTLLMAMSRFLDIRVRELY